MTDPAKPAGWRRITYFKVRGDSAPCYILCNDVLTGRGELTMFDRAGAIGRRER